MRFSSIRFQCDYCGSPGLEKAEILSTRITPHHSHIIQTSHLCAITSFGHHLSSRVMGHVLATNTFRHHPPPKRSVFLKFTVYLRETTSSATGAKRFGCPQCFFIRRIGTDLDIIRHRSEAFWVSTNRLQCFFIRRIGTYPDIIRHRSEAFWVPTMLLHS